MTRGTRTPTERKDDVRHAVALAVARVHTHTRTQARGPLIMAVPAAVSGAQWLVALKGWEQVVSLARGGATVRGRTKSLEARQTAAGGKHVLSRQGQSPSGTCVGRHTCNTRTPSVLGVPQGLGVRLLRPLTRAHLAKPHTCKGSQVGVTVPFLPPSYPMEKQSSTPRRVPCSQESFTGGAGQGHQSNGGSLRGQESPKRPRSVTSSPCTRPQYTHQARFATANGFHLYGRPVPTVSRA